MISGKRGKRYKGAVKREAAVTIKNALNMGANNNNNTIAANPENNNSDRAKGFSYLTEDQNQRDACGADMEAKVESVSLSSIRRLRELAASSPSVDAAQSAAPTRMDSKALSVADAAPLLTPRTPDLLSRLTYLNGSNYERASRALEVDARPAPPPFAGRDYANEEDVSPPREPLVRGRAGAENEDAPSGEPSNIFISDDVNNVALASLQRLRDAAAQHSDKSRASPPPAPSSPESRLLRMRAIAQPFSPSATEEQMPLFPSSVRVDAPEHAAGASRLAQLQARASAAAGSPSAHVVSPQTVGDIVKGPPPPTPTTAAAPVSPRRKPPTSAKPPARPARATRKQPAVSIRASYSNPMNAVELPTTIRAHVNSVNQFIDHHHHTAPSSAPYGVPISVQVAAAATQPPRSGKSSARRGSHDYGKKAHISAPQPLTAVAKMQPARPQAAHVDPASPIGARGSAPAPAAPAPHYKSGSGSVFQKSRSARCVVFDTSSLLVTDPGVLHLLVEKWVACVPFTVVDELDKMNKMRVGEHLSADEKREKEWRRHRARELRNWMGGLLGRKDSHIRLQKRTEVVEEYSRSALCNDDSILGFAVYLKKKKERVLFISEDKFLRIKAQTELGEAYTYAELRQMLGLRP